MKPGNTDLAKQNYLADTHCHLDFAAFDDIRASLLKECYKKQIRLIVVPGVQMTSWHKLFELPEYVQSDKENGSLTIRLALGLHPYFIESHRPEHLDQLRALLAADAKKRIVAVGEGGLDNRIGYLDKQIEYLDYQFDIALENDLPLVLHSVKTHELLLSQLKLRQYKLRGVIHGFSGSYEQAMQFVDAGFRIGVGGIITHERANKTRKAIASLPLSAIVLETDSPDMPLYGAKSNSPLNLSSILAQLVILRAESEEEIKNSLWKNSLELYGLD
jgi:TatD DNase family protein